MVNPLPEPYASMSPTDPRRREYLSGGGLRPTLDVADAVRSLEVAWLREEAFCYISIISTNASARIAVDEPVELEEREAVAPILARARQLGWHLEHMDHVFVPGAEISLGAGVRHARGAIIALMTFGRPELSQLRAADQ